MPTLPVDARVVSDGEATVIPTSQLVIVRESEVGDGLAEAIAKIRSRPETACSRILVIGPDAEASAAESEADVLSEAAELPVPNLPVNAAQLGRLYEVEALQCAAGRLLPLLECMDRFFDEAGDVIDELETTVSDQPRARILNRLRSLHDVLGWTRAVSLDLAQEARALEAGARSADPRGLVEEAARQAEVFFPGIRVHIAADSISTACRARAAELIEAFFLGFLLVAHRLGGRGLIRVERGVREATLSYRILGVGDAQPIDLPDVVSRFRSLVGDRLGGCVAPDWYGPSGTGLVLQLPVVDIR